MVDINTIINSLIDVFRSILGATGLKGLIFKLSDSNIGQIILLVLSVVGGWAVVKYVVKKIWLIPVIAFIIYLMLSFA